MGETELGHFAHAAYRANRTVLVSQDPDPKAKLTVFVGLYNSDPYFEHLVRQIESQTMVHARWLFVDNASTDSTWEHITTWAASSMRDVTVVRNGFNLGATGSIFVNFDLVTTEWATFIHQDDIYFPEHIETLATAASTSPEDTVGVFSDLGRTDPEGRAIGSFPPPIWLVPDLDPATLFLALLRNHCIPWPALAVRTQEFRETEAPWHSTAFPDTEITMRLVGRGRFVHVEKETMRYRDSVTSESRSIDDRERKFGATVSLFRVFNSAEFAAVAGGVAIPDRAAFVNGLASSIRVRLGDTDRASLVLAGALERLAELWDDADAASLELLSSVYAGLGAAATSSLLGRMAEAAGGSPDVAPMAPPVDAPLTSQPRHSYFVGNVVKHSYERIGHRIPYRVRKVVARWMIRSATRSDSYNAWNFEWR